MTEVEVNGGVCGDLDTSTKTALCSSSRKRRVAHLQVLHERLENREIQSKFLPALLRIFFGTYAYYYDRNSRLAVENCLQVIFKPETPPQAWVEFLKNVLAETSKSGLAPSNAFVLARWCSLILPTIAATNSWDEWGVETLVSNSQALELCLSLSTRPNIKHTALFATKQGLAKAFDARGDLIQEAVEKLTAKAPQPTPNNAIILGAIAAICAGNPKWKAILYGKKSEYYAFYNREIIGSRTHIEPHVANGLEEFFRSFTAAEDVEKDIIPPLEKALLRAPEVVLDDLLTPLFHALPESIDLSVTLRERLMKPLLANVKSTNVAIRQGALDAFKAAVVKSRNEEVMAKITEDVLMPLKTGKLTSADQRTTYAEILAVLPVFKATVLPSSVALAAVAGKEANEAALNAETLALLNYLLWAIQNEMSIEKSVVEVFAKGIADKKVNVKRIWTLRLGELLWASTELDAGSTLTTLAEAAIAPLMGIWKEATTNSIAMAQSGLVTAAYVFTVLWVSNLPTMSSSKIETQLKKAHLGQQVLAVDPKPSFLLNPRIYGKLTSGDEFRWFIRALSVVSDDVISAGSSDSAVSIAWSQAFLFCICSSTVQPNVRKEAVSALSKLYVTNPTPVANIVIEGLWRWRDTVESAEKDTAAAAAKTANQYLHVAAHAICLPPSDAVKIGGDVDIVARKNQMVSMFVLARPELIPRVSWINLCLRAQVDPGELARSSGNILVQQILDLTDFHETLSSHQSNAVKKAACNAAAELAFVAPDSMTTRIVELIQQDLDPQLLADIGPTEAAIYRTPEGTAFVDVLATKSQNYVPNKNVKDYDTLKWEEDLRAQLAQKKGQQKKLTPEENAKVNSQLKKEADIRLNIRHVVAKLLRGIGIIESLATGPPTEASLWMSPAVKALVDIISAGAGLLTGNVGSNAYIACSERLATRIGPLRRFIGIATLRALDVPQLLEELIQEPLEALVTRVLYRLRFSGEQRPFDTV
ncbi:hypothetical protein BJ878DRAFT_405706, partial [Calycina marina]